MTIKEEANELWESFGSVACSILHIDKTITLLKTVMSGCSSTSERYEITNLIKRYKEVKLELENS